MALLFSWSKCGLCGQLLEENGPTIAFPAFVCNEADPLFYFSDAGFHEECIKRHPMGEHALQVIEDFRSKTGSGKRKCIVCHQEVMDWREYFGTDYLTYDSIHPLFEFNYIHLHKSCLQEWELKEKFIKAVNESIASGTWKGNSLIQILQEMDRLL